MGSCGTPHLTASQSVPPPSRHLGFPPNQIKSPTLSLLNTATLPSHLPQLHARLIKTNTSHNNFYLSKLISLYIHHNLLDDALLLLHRAKKPNTLVWNTLLKAYSDHGLFSDALSLFRLMLHCGVRPDCYTFPFLLKTCEVVCVGSSIHALVLKLGLEENLHAENSLLGFYCRCCCVEDAQKVFDEMADRDVVSYTALVSGYAKAGDVESAMEIFELMPERDVVSWGAMISGLAQNGFPEEALCLFQEMQVVGVPISEVALVSSISACASLGLRSLGLWLHAFMIRRGIAIGVFTGTALVDMYGKCGDLHCASQVFQLMNEKSVATWNSMIGGLAMNGSVIKALALIEEMVGWGIEPNAVTLSNVLSACRHGGLVNEGRRYFENWSREYGICLNLDHYGCMVDLLGRAGCVDEAYRLIQSMPMEPNEVIWGALLGACKIHGNLILAEEALKRLVELDPANGGNYVLLSNMYAELGRWKEVERVRAMMRDGTVVKTRGCSSIDLDTVAHEFSAGNESYPGVL
ncbi:putative tetratricopeptide-like helical domain superfamily [Dioscorea sansibarensis]